MNDLYPLKFKPQFFQKPWGGENISKFNFLSAAQGMQCGEAWLISGVIGQQSVVSNGFLAGNELNELIEVYMEDLVGEAIFDEYGEVFPILIKMIDTTEWLSIQVHPDNQLAQKQHGVPFGKTEMWYIVDADNNAEILAGFKEKTNSDSIKNAIENNILKNYVNLIVPKKNDVFFIPSGKIHALGKGLTLFEIQQTSDFTYRLYDWERKDKNGKTRELHIDNGLAAINYEDICNGKTDPIKINNTIETLVNCPQFTTNKIIIKNKKSILRNYELINSFIILVCVKGKLKYRWNQDSDYLVPGECTLIPSILSEIELVSEGETEVLEVFISN